MAPVRSQKSYKAGESSTPTGSKSSKPKSNSQRFPKHTADVSALPGVQKLKASLRQTRRLLAKDKLAADARVETERRLKALEADILQAESARKEKTMSVRYHKVKFFERQKVIRKIKQTKKLLEDPTGKLKTKARKKLEGDLAGHRVDLNYIMNYPKSKKYISLFPPQSRLDLDPDASEPPSDAAEAEPGADEYTNKTNLQRDEVRVWIQDRMDKGELEAEPEMHLDEREKSGTRKKGDAEWLDESRKAKKGHIKGSSESIAGVVEKDAFFESDGEEDTSEGESS